MSGIQFNVKTELNINGIKTEIDSNARKAQAGLDAMVLQDSNYFIPIKTHTLENSSLINTQIGTGVIVWRTPYARRLYYEYSKPDYQPNPNACGKWFEAAKARWLDKWVNFLNERIKHI